MQETKSIQIEVSLHRKLKRIALDRGTTMKAMLAAWIATLKIGKAA